MKMVKNIAIIACAASFMFASVSFHMSNVYTDMDGSTAVGSGFGASWALNENTSLGYDTELGMIFSFDVPAGVSLRFGTSASGDFNGDNTDDGANTSVGLGYTWWSGGTGLKTSISTNYDYSMDSDGKDDADADLDEAGMGKLSVVVSFGF